MTLPVAIALLSIVLLAITVAEVSARARFASHREYWIHPPGISIEVRLAPDVGANLAPVVVSAYNSRGERGREPPSADAAVYRVVVIGGSAAECFALDQGQTWAAEIERGLLEPAARARLGVDDAHVGLAARSSMRARDLVEMLQRLLPLHARIDCLVVLAGSSDGLQWLVQGGHPEPQDTRADRSAIFEWHPEQSFGWTPKAMALTELIRRHRVRRARNLTRERVGAWLSRARQQRAAAAGNFEPLPDPSGMLALFERHFREFVALAQSSAGRVLVVPQECFDKPNRTREEDGMLWQGGIGDPSAGPVTRFVSTEAVGEMMRLIRERTVAVAEACGAEIVDCADTVPLTMDFYYDDFHLTPRGASLLGACIAAAILEGHARPVALRPHQDGSDA